MFQKLGLSEHSSKLNVLCGKCLISSFLKNVISSSQTFILSDLFGNQTYILFNSNIQKFIHNFEKSEILFCYPRRWRVHFFLYQLSFKLIPTSKQDSKSALFFFEICANFTGLLQGWISTYLGPMIGSWVHRTIKDLW